MGRLRGRQAFLKVRYRPEEVRVWGDAQNALTL
jgi:hypothetical protein